jgi:hypothetical protein
MITIDELAVTVNVEGGGEAGEVAFARLFNRYVDRWWREKLAHARQEARSASDRSVVRPRQEIA